MTSRISLFIIIILTSIQLFSQSAFLSVDQTEGCQTLTVTTITEFLPTNVDTAILDFGDGQIDTIPNPTYGRTDTHTYNTVGNYTIKLTIIDNGNTAFDTKVVYVYPFPDASFTSSLFPYLGAEDTFLFSNRRYLFIAQQTADTNHLWAVDGILQYYKTDSMAYNFPSTGSHLIKHTITVNGCTSYDSLEINITEQDVKIPNVFTPNGDGQNDIFYIQTDGETKYNFTVWNRHGAMVFILENYKVISWDGRTYWGEELHPGNYYYVLESESGETHKGIIYLSR